MSKLVMVAFLMTALSSTGSAGEPEVKLDNLSCKGLPVSLFEGRLPAEARRLVLDDTMLQTFVEFWNAGSRPDLPKRPERVVIYSLPGLPLIIGYQERQCIIAYLTIESDKLWRWLRPRFGWKV